MDRRRPWVGCGTPCDSTDLALFDASPVMTTRDGATERSWHSRWLIFSCLLARRISLSHLPSSRGLGWLACSASPVLCSFVSSLACGSFSVMSNLLSSPTRSLGVGLPTCNTVLVLPTSRLQQYIGCYATTKFQKLWKARVEPKCRFFMWPWLWERILTNDNLQERGWPNNGEGNLCDQEEETTGHLILHCTFARQVWLLITDWLALPAPLLQNDSRCSPASWWNDVASLLTKYHTSVPIYGCWHIWKDRNRRVEQVLGMIKAVMVAAHSCITWDTFGENEPEPEPD